MDEHFEIYFTHLFMNDIFFLLLNVLFLLFFAAAGFISYGLCSTILPVVQILSLIYYEHGNSEEIHFYFHFNILFVVAVVVVNSGKQHYKVSNNIKKKNKL